MYPELKRYFAFLNSTEWIGRSNQAVQADLNSVKPGEEQNLKGHVIICGYGPTGNIVAKKLQSTGLSVVIIDLNYKVIQSLKSSKQYAIYGDSSSSIVLEAAGLQNASLLIVTIPDPAAMRSLIKKVKKLHPFFFFLAGGVAGLLMWLL